MEKLKAALIRDEGFPIGQPAPCHFNCECGATVPVTCKLNSCTCGLVYDAAGWIQNRDANA